MEIDAGKQVLSQLIDTFGMVKLSDSNEAETRKKVIDVILENLGNWKSKTFPSEILNMINLEVLILNKNEQSKVLYREIP